jgi:integrase
MTSKRDHGDGGLDERGPDRWRLRWRIHGRRYTKSFCGSKRAAQAELRRLLSEVDAGVRVAPDKMTVAAYLRDWLGGHHGLSPKTVERYRQLAERQIIPHLGATGLQHLRPAAIHEWHGALLRTGLAARTAGHAHRVLHRALARAVEFELISRNVASVVRPPKVETAEVEILNREQIADVLARLRGHPLYAIIAFALGTGMRRGEICALAWDAIDGATVRVERSLEETEQGLRFKPPKTRAGHRTISLRASTVEILREHRQQQLEHRLLYQLGRPTAADLVFPLADGTPYPPDKLSRDWGNVVRDKKLPRVRFHALRHSHASALIAAGLDIVSVSQRLGHGSPAITLSVYAHRFVAKDAAAAKAIDAIMR